MAKHPTCLVCQKRMEVGFITDLGHLDRARVPTWTAGHPGTDGPNNPTLPVVAYRCPQCEALRLYAPTQPFR